MVLEPKMLHLRRGQVLTSEFIVAAFIFTIALGGAIFIWDNVAKNIIVSEVLHEMDSVSTAALEKLVRTSGYPEDWETLSDLDEIHSVGLATESRVLDKSKVLRFIQLMDSSAYNNLCRDATISNYECSRSLLGLHEYDFSFTLFDMEDNILTLGGVNCSAGKQPTGEDYRISVTRSAVLNGSIVKATLVVWK